MSAALPLVAVYADESCLGNGKEGANPGGAGVLIEYRHGDGRITRRDLWVSEPGTTNNRMALRSVSETFLALSAKGQRFRVQFTTDSRYIVDGMTGWVFGWARAGWKRKTGPRGMEAQDGPDREPRALARCDPRRFAARRELALGARPRRTSAERVRQPSRHARRGGAVVVGRRRGQRVRDLARRVSR